MMAFMGCCGDPPVPPDPLAWGAATTWNPADMGSHTLLTNNNLTASFSGAAGTAQNGWVRSTTSVSQGRHVFEYVSGQYSTVGVVGAIGAWPFIPMWFVGNYSGHKNYYDGTTWTDEPYTDAFTNEVIGILLDMDAGTIEMFKNGVSAGIMFSGLSGEVTAAASAVTYGSYIIATANFGATPFKYTYPL